jgi:hypothetical protein
LGNGFCCPADAYPFPDLRPWLPADPRALLRTEESVLENANCVLRSRGQPALTRLGQMYGEVDEVLLTTLAEFDYYPRRGPVRYRGPWMPEGGGSPAWPGGSGKKIFAYLKGFPALPRLLGMLRETGAPAIIHIEGMTAEFARQHAAPTLRFQADRLDLRRAAAECDLAIFNGSQGSTILTLLAGKPVLQVPLALEHELNARATVRMGAGEIASAAGGESLAAGLSGLLQSDACGAAARRFALRYAGHSPAEESRRALADVLNWLP